MEVCLFAFAEKEEKIDTTLSYQNIPLKLPNVFASFLTSQLHQNVLILNFRFCLKD